MAVYETKVVQVRNEPEILNFTNEEYGHFGWSVQNVQVTQTQERRQISSDYVETTTYNYATITYQRDRHMNNYAQITELEKEYFEIVDEIPRAKAYTKPSKLKALFKIKKVYWILTILAYIIPYTLGVIFDEKIPLISCTAYAIFPFGWGYYFALDDPNLVSKEATDRVAALRARRDEVIREAESLL